MGVRLTLPKQRLTVDGTERAIRLFIAEGDGAAGRPSTAQERHQGTALLREVKKTSVTYQSSDQSSP